MPNFTEKFSWVIWLSVVDKKSCLKKPIIMTFEAEQTRKKNRICSSECQRCNRDDKSIKAFAFLLSSKSEKEKRKKKLPESLRRKKEFAPRSPLSLVNKRSLETFFISFRITLGKKILNSCPKYLLRCTMNSCGFHFEKYLSF